MVGVAGTCRTARKVPESRPKSGVGELESSNSGATSVPLGVVVVSDKTVTSLGGNKGCKPSFPQYTSTACPKSFLVRSEKEFWNDRSVVRGEETSSPSTCLR
jgi:hypothetical protein